MDSKFITITGKNGAPRTLSMDDHVPVDDAALITGFSSSSLNKARCSGINTPPFRKVGKNVRYRVRDLVDWLNARERHSTSEVSAEAARASSAA